MSFICRVILDSGSLKFWTYEEKDAMAKIKFNLNFGGKQIRTLDDQRENFSIRGIAVAVSGKVGTK